MPWNEPGDEDQPDPSLDTRLSGFGYGIIASPIDDADWVQHADPFQPRLRASCRFRPFDGLRPPGVVECFSDY